MTGTGKAKRFSPNIRGVWTALSKECTNLPPRFIIPCLTAVTTRSSGTKANGEH